MKSYAKRTNYLRTYWWVNVFFLITIMFLITINAADAQTNNRERVVRSNGKTFKHKSRQNGIDRSSDCVRLPNRTIDGTCNNISASGNDVWGATDIPFRRVMSAAYGAPDFYNDMAGNCRLTPRAISNLVVAQSEDILSPRNLSSLVFTWGQFLDHDIDLTPETETEYVPILLPSNEPLFTQPIPFLRSETYPGTGVDSDRQQENLITSWIDASQVYGSEESRANWLRTFSKGKLKTSEGDLLPYNTIDGNLDSAIDPNAPSMGGDNGGTAKVFVAGDVRANEQPGLTALHTLFVREHNRICDQLENQGMMNDQEIYQRARKRVGAYMQSITYNGFLPALGVSVQPYGGYNDNIKPDISNMFATAAYRLGHTMVTNEIPLIAPNCQTVDGGSLPLITGFFNPEVTATYGIEPFLRGLASQTQQKVDSKIVDNLRNFLFGDPSSGNAFGLDLASLNIQRGRDHGLPDYNTVRAHLTGQAAEDFEDITSDPLLEEALRAAYGSVYDMDLWVGLLSEDPLNGSSIGLTLHIILADQFQDLRNGDFYYYRNDPAFSGQQRNQIDNTSLSDIILRNTPINNLQGNAFFAANCNNGGGDNPDDDPNGPGGPGGGGGGPGGGGGGPGGGGQGGGGQGNNIVINPNPADGKIQLQATLDTPNDRVLIQVQGLDGKVYYKRTVDKEDDTLFYNLNLEQLANGVYFISVQSGKTILTEKLVIN